MFCYRRCNKNNKLEETINWKKSGDDSSSFLEGEKFLKYHSKLD